MQLLLQFFVVLHIIFFDRSFFDSSLGQSSEAVGIIITGCQFRVAPV
jgi:hypothetical protein